MLRKLITFLTTAGLGPKAFSPPMVRGCMLQSLSSPLPLRKTLHRTPPVQLPIASDQVLRTRCQNKTDTKKQPLVSFRFQPLTIDRNLDHLRRPVGEAALLCAR